MIQYHPYLREGGDYSLFKANQRAEELQKQGLSPINLTLGDPTLETYAPVITQTIASLQKSKISQYPSAQGSLHYRKAVADWAKRNHSIDLDPQTEILSANGTKEAIFHFAMLFDWSQNQTILQPSLSYPVYASSAHFHQAQLVSLSISAKTQFLPDLDSIPEQVLRSCQIFWINSPNNPTSTTFDAPYAEKLLRLSEKYEFIIASDECYNDLYFTENRPVSFLDYPESDRWIVFRSLSKRSHVTGYRIGAMISRNQQLMKMLTKLRPHLGTATPSFIQEGAIEAWKDDQHPKQHRQYYRQLRDLLRAALLEKGFCIFGGENTFYGWFSHPQIPTSDALIEVFVKAGLLLVPGTAFGADGEGYVRMAYCVPIDTCQEIVRRIQRLEITSEP